MATPISGTAPVLDAPPASPDAVQAAQPSPDASMRALAPEQQPDPGGTSSMQLAEITLKTGQAIGQGLTILGQLHPAFAPLADQMTTMLRQGLKSVLEQGLGTSEPAPGALPGQSSSMSGLAPMTQGMPMPEEGSSAGGY